MFKVNKKFDKDVRKGNLQMMLAKTIDEKIINEYRVL
jgi:hypothetical protein